MTIALTNFYLYGGYIFILFAIFRISNAFDTPIGINNCDLNYFRCDNGNCIKSESLCDGKKDCSDGTDETRKECLRSDIVCPEFAFRCNYGACVDGDAQCNGINDCADESDEKSLYCHRRNHNNTSTNQEECSDYHFQCENRQCIDITALCDGSTECNDRSDETSTVCGTITCPEFSFQCAYGACINEDKKCNGLRNCADGSDEEYALCSDTINLDRHSSLIQTTQSSSRLLAGRNRPPCRRPGQPTNGYWKLHKSQCTGDSHCDTHHDNLEPGTYLIYVCKNGYKLNGSSDVYCGPGGKWSKKPTCIEIKCGNLSSSSRLAECTYDDQWISCEAPVPPRTIAKLSCRMSFRHDSTLLGLQRDQVRCNATGEWEPAPIECVPECGVRTNTTYTPLIVNGRLPHISEFPWHATVYRSTSMGQEKSFICGATIITDQLLITAAHCVYDEDISRVADPTMFSIATGNTFRDYNSPMHDSRITHKRNVTKIYINCNYLGLNGNYARDIAVLRIDKPFVFTAFLVPICLDRTLNDQTAIDVGKVGIIAGFGRTRTGSSSGVLQSISVPVVSLSNCRAASIASYAEKYLTIDKFCAGYTNGTSVCDGDSGSGLAFNDHGLWYLRGIVSVGIGARVTGGSRTCENNIYSLYTKISSHISWIEDIIFKIKIDREISSCNSTL